MKRVVCATLAMLAVGTFTTVAAIATKVRQDGGRVALVFAGGHETDPRDRGRPVVLVAAGLGVPPEVFREAFSHVKPAPAGAEPDPEQVRRNKDALLDRLGRYGVTNDRLDEVSNYYRYNRGRGEMWRNSPAAGYAVVRKGAVVKLVITDPGSGYSSTPTVSIPGYAKANVQAAVKYGTDLRRNGSIGSLTLVKPSR